MMSTFYIKIDNYQIEKILASEMTDYGEGRGQLRRVYF